MNSRTGWKLTLLILAVGAIVLGLTVGMSAQVQTTKSTTSHAASQEVQVERAEVILVSGNDLVVFLYRITDVRDITLSAWICARLLMSDSVMPSAKYSCAGSPERFCKGRTAIERIGADVLATTVLRRFEIKNIATVTPAISKNAAAMTKASRDRLGFGLVRSSAGTSTVDTSLPGVRTSATNL